MAGESSGLATEHSGASASGEGAGSSPQVEKHVGLLVQNHLDIAGVNQGVVHLVPLSVACLGSTRNRKQNNQ